MIYHDYKESRSSKNSSVSMVDTSSNKKREKDVYVYDNTKTEFKSTTSNRDSRNILLTNTYQRTSYRKNSPK